jgi:hypothetical protein
MCAIYKPRRNAEKKNAEKRRMHKDSGRRVYRQDFERVDRGWVARLFFPPFL